MPMPAPGISRRSALLGLLALSAGAVLVLRRGRRPTIGDGIAVLPDPRIRRSCQDFLDMMRLRGTDTRPRSVDSVFVDFAGWLRLTRIEQIAFANAVAGRAHGKHVRFLADGEVGRVYLGGTDRAVATARNTGVTFS